MLKKILVANRGEIAVRIMRTCSRMGIASVAVYSEADSRSLHIRKADETVALGGVTAMESYLAMEKIIDAALQTHCEAIHPGYGFLSESPRFARLVNEAGIVFIGPSPSSIGLLGDKLAAKELARSEGVPVIESHPEPISDAAMALEVGEKIGYPLLLKPAAGGGGKGMRIVYDAGGMAGALSVCRKEAQKAFADDRVFVEKYIPRPRHVEFQILVDNFGNAVHLGERECSIQRRYQKIIEETPSLAISDSLRDEIGAVACRLARRADYVNAGTVEFLLDTQGQYYFLEMNSRIQVEHPVTEMALSVDLVNLQIRIASGEKLPFQQQDIRLSGCAMEARVCAEDPARSFFPVTGLITRYSQPGGEHLRVDSGVEAGSLVSVYYDSLLSKVIAWGEDREQARKRLVAALNGYHIEGVVTNISFLNQVLNLSAFRSGDISTGFIEQNFEEGRAKEDPSPDHLRLVALAATLIYHNRNVLVRESLKPMISRIGGSPQPTGPYEYIVKCRYAVFAIQLKYQGLERSWVARVGDREYTVVTPPFEFYRRRLKLEINGEIHRFILDYRGSFIEGRFCGIHEVFEIYTPQEWALASTVRSPISRPVDNALRSPMPGLVMEIKVAVGDRVYHGQDLFVLESMKMESCIPSPGDGIVSEVAVRRGQTVETGDVLIRFVE
ncbi:MAG: acetyl/propionyl-CoA carboxylase subunit alpha [Dehalococcoidia bacterium]|nr:acetyl/propionyl-CoA carboxylase subunit alpha [Dehalococcoidia bacterium]